MEDYQAQIDKLRREAAECVQFGELTPDKAKREIFRLQAGRLTALADRVELAMQQRQNAGGSVSYPQDD